MTKMNKTTDTEANLRKALLDLHGRVSNTLDSITEALADMLADMKAPAKDKPKAKPVAKSEKPAAKGKAKADPLETVRSTLTEMGVQFHPRSGLAKLEGMLAEAVAKADAAAKRKAARAAKAKPEAPAKGDAPKAKGKVKPEAKEEAKAEPEVSTEMRDLVRQAKALGVKVVVGMKKKALKAGIAEAQAELLKPFSKAAKAEPVKEEAPKAKGKAQTKEETVKEEPAPKTKVQRGRPVRGSKAK